MTTTTGSPLDLHRVRSQFPALRDGTAYFDGPGGSQTPRCVAHAVAATLGAGLSNRGTVTASERRADEVVRAARAAVGDLLGADPGGVVFGRSMTQLTFDLARALAKQWGPGDQVVVTRLDHDANIRPWVLAAEAAGATVRWVDFDPGTAELSFDPEVLSERTRLVAVTGASNLLGTRPDVSAIAAATHEAGALLYVDGVHLTPHAPVDVAALGADLFACSSYKFFGPHLGMVAAAPSLLERIDNDKLRPATTAVPERFELGTLPYEMLAGVTAAVDFLADLVPGQGSRRDRVLASMRALEETEEALFRRLLGGLRSLERVRTYGTPSRRTPTVLFTVEGVPPGVVYEQLAARGVNAPASSFYAIEAAQWIGLGPEGAVRAGLAPYTSEDDVDRLLAGVAAVAG
ncbi:MAG TPA: cysteine desulfurase-like protein [Nocardioidaceae bacterium]|nr:cysteine desulfurase-like protein [Nocardioidaceae bacterium]